MDRLIDEVDPDLLVLSAGARPRLAPVMEQSWDSFSAPWNTDLRIAFQVGQTALRRPLRPGSLVIIMSSGAALVGSPMSGGYAGAKRMQMFLAGDLQRAADAAKLGIRFLALVPKQVLAQSEMGGLVADAYAKMNGITPEKFMERFPTPLTPQGVARTIVDIAQGELGPEGDDVGRQRKRSRAAVSPERRSPPPELAEARARFLDLVGEIRPELHRYCARLTGSVDRRRRRRAGHARQGVLRHQHGARDAAAAPVPVSHRAQHGDRRPAPLRPQASSSWSADVPEDVADRRAAGSRGRARGARDAS